MSLTGMRPRTAASSAFYGHALSGEDAMEASMKDTMNSTATRAQTDTRIRSHVDMWISETREQHSLAPVGYVRPMTGHRLTTMQTQRAPPTVRSKYVKIDLGGVPDQPSGRVLPLGHLGRESDKFGHPKREQLNFENRHLRASQKKIDEAYARLAQNASRRMKHPDPSGAARFNGHTQESFDWRPFTAKGKDNDRPITAHSGGGGRSGSSGGRSGSLSSGSRGSLSGSGGGRIGRNGSLGLSRPTTSYDPSSAWKTSTKIGVPQRKEFEHHLPEHHIHEVEGDHRPYSPVAHPDKPHCGFLTGEEASRFAQSNAYSPAHAESFRDRHPEEIYGQRRAEGSVVKNNGVPSVGRMGNFGTGTMGGGGMKTNKQTTSRGGPSRMQRPDPHHVPVRMAPVFVPKTSAQESFDRPLTARRGQLPALSSPKEGRPSGGPLLL